MSSSWIILILCMVLSTSAWGADFKDEGMPCDIKVEIGKVTQVEFPAKIAKVVKGGSQDSVLVEVLDNSVYLLPKTEDPSDVFITTTAGNSYPLNLLVGTDHDIKIRIGNFTKKGLYPASSGYLDLMDLMKDLLLEKELDGATTLPANGKVILSNKQMSLTVEKAYEMTNWNAYILVARNMLNNAVIVPIEQISLPNLVAISADRDMISAKGQEGDIARIYIIVGKSNEYSAI